MATIALYANKINNMPSLLGDVKSAVNDLKSEFNSLKRKCNRVESSICNLDEVVSTVSAATKLQEDKVTALQNLQDDIAEFADEAARIDGAVADVVQNNKDDFYDKYSYLKPNCERTGWEKFCDGCKAVGEWCKENWVMLVTIVAVVAIAVLSVFTFGLAAGAVAAIAGLISLALCVADVICMVATGGKGIADLCNENGLGWLGQIFRGISIGCDIVAIAIPAISAIKTMSQVGVKAFVKGSVEAFKFAWDDFIKKVFKSGFKTGIKNAGSFLFKTCIFDIDDISRVNSSGKRVLDIFADPSPSIVPEGIIRNNYYGPDGDVIYPGKSDGLEHGFVGGIFDEITLQPGTKIDRYGKYNGSFFAEVGLPFENRALPHKSKEDMYLVYEVTEAFNVKSGRIASWFGQPGGGIQYMTTGGMKVHNLLNAGKIRVVPPDLTLIRNIFRHYAGYRFKGLFAGD